MNMYSHQILVASKKAWERLSSILDGDEATKFENIDEFDKFYSVLIEKLHNNDKKENT